MKPFLAGFSGELLKVAFGPEQAEKIFSLAKKIKLPKGSSRIFAEGEAGMMGVPRRARALQDAKNNVHATEGLEGRLEAAGFSREEAVQHGQSIRENLDNATRKIKGFTNQVPQGAIVRGKKSTDHALRRLAPHRGIELPEHTAPKDKKMVNAVIEGHELDETRVKGGAGMAALGHRSPDVMLREHNRVATLPKEHEGARKYMQSLRAAPGAEGDILKEHGIDYGQEGARISRHARRHLTDLINRKALED